MRGLVYLKRLNVLIYPLLHLLDTLQLLAGCFHVYSSVFNGGIVTLYNNYIKSKE